VGFVGESEVVTVVTVLVANLVTAVVEVEEWNGLFIPVVAKTVVGGTVVTIGGAGGAAGVTLLVAAAWLGCDVRRSIVGVPGGVTWFVRQLKRCSKCGNPRFTR